MKRLLKQNLNYLFIVLSFFIFILGGQTCDTKEVAEGITVEVENYSSVAVYVTYYGPDSSESEIIDSKEWGRQIYNKSGGNWTVVVKPMGDWLSFAQAKRDRLIGALAQARETGNIDDIYSIAEELRAVSTHITTIIQASKARSKSGPIEGGKTAYVYVYNGELVNSIVLSRKER